MRRARAADVLERDDRTARGRSCATSSSPPPSPGADAGDRGPPDGGGRAGRRAPRRRAAGGGYVRWPARSARTRTSVAATRVLGIGRSVDDLLARVADCAGRREAQDRARAGTSSRSGRCAPPSPTAGWPPMRTAGTGSTTSPTWRRSTSSASPTSSSRCPGLTRRGRRGSRAGRRLSCSTSRSATSTPVRAAIALGGLGGLNLKPGKGGGLQATARTRSRSRPAKGIDVFVGGMLETGVGRAGAVALAALDACTLADRPRSLGLVLRGRPDRADRRRRRRPARRAPRARHRGGARRRPPRRGHRRSRWCSTG